MCIPRSAVDPLCDQEYRPTDSSEYVFSLDEGLHMVPFRVNDYLTYAGVEYNGEILCYSIIANVGAYSENPGYIILELVLIAPLDLTNNVNLEAGTTRVSILQNLITDL